VTDSLHSQRYGRVWLDAFGLDPSLIHGNHGSYGAVPRDIRARQREIQDEVNTNPTGFLRDLYPVRIREAAASVAGLLSGDARDWVFVENATAGMNIVIAGCGLGPGDEVLTSDQVYGAVRKSLARMCARSGASVVEVALPLPLTSSEDLFERITSAVTPRTRLVVLDHISSPSGLVFPVQRLCAHFRDLGITTLVDGAHGPGSVDVDVLEIGADYYTGNMHKWLSAPLGAGVLWCHPDHQARLEPLVVSHGIYDGFNAAFDWPGTRDPSAWLTVPIAIGFYHAQGGGALRARNHAVALAAGHRIAEEFGTVLAAPDDMQASMVAIRLLAEHLRPEECHALQHRMQAEQGAVVAITPASGATWLRLSATIYSEVEDLVEAGRRVFRAMR
jgi:isopenicillin-N epimerase